MISWWDPTCVGGGGLAQNPRSPAPGGLRGGQAGGLTFHCTTEGGSSAQGPSTRFPLTVKPRLL